MRRIVEADYVLAILLLVIKSKVTVYEKKLIDQLIASFRANDISEYIAKRNLRQFRC